MKITPEGINNMYDLVALGELLIDYTPLPCTSDGKSVFEQNPGGAPANVLVCAAKLGLATAIIGKVGDDMQGQCIIQTLCKDNVDTSGLIVDPKYFTTLAFISLDENGERKFSFARKPGADTQLTAGEVDMSLLSGAKVFHFGSLSLTDQPSRDATIYAVRAARDNGAVISYDPNYRDKLWSCRQAAETQMRAVLPYVDMLKISEEETELITGFAEPADAARELIDNGIGCAVITLGERGAFIAVRGENGIISRTVRGFVSDVVDTTGAGDAFWGGFLTQFIKGGKKLTDLTIDELVQYVKYGNAVASLCVERRGGIPAMPEMIAVQKRLLSM